MLPVAMELNWSEDGIIDKFTMTNAELVQCCEICEVALLVMSNRANNNELNFSEHIGTQILV